MHTTICTTGYASGGSESLPDATVSIFVVAATAVASRCSR